MINKYTDKFGNFIINDSLVLAKKPLCIDKVSNYQFIYAGNYLFNFNEGNDLAACSNGRHIPTLGESYKIIEFFGKILKGKKEFTVKSTGIYGSNIGLEISKKLGLCDYDCYPVRINDFFDYRTKAFWINESRYSRGDNKIILMIEPNRISNYMISGTLNGLGVWLVCNHKDREFNSDGNYVYIQ